MADLESYKSTHELNQVIFLSIVAWSWYYVENYLYLREIFLWTYSEVDNSRSSSLCSAFLFRGALLLKERSKKLILSWFDSHFVIWKFQLNRINCYRFENFQLSLRSNIKPIWGSSKNMGLESTHHTTRVTNSILLFFGNFKHPVESHDLTRLRVDPTHKDGLYLLQQKNGIL